MRRGSEGGREGSPIARPGQASRPGGCLRKGQGQRGRHSEVAAPPCTAPLPGIQEAPEPVPSRCSRRRHPVQTRPHGPRAPHTRPRSRDTAPPRRRPPGPGPAAPAHLVPPTLSCTISPLPAAAAGKLPQCPPAISGAPGARAAPPARPGPPAAAEGGRAAGLPHVPLRSGGAGRRPASASGGH